MGGTICSYLVSETHHPLKDKIYRLKMFWGGVFLIIMRGVTPIPKNKYAHVLISSNIDKGGIIIITDMGHQILNS